MIDRAKAPFGRVAALIAVLTAMISCSQEPDELVLVTPSTFIDRDVLVELGNRFNDHSEIKVRLTEERLAGEAAMDMLSSGQADIALISNNMPFREGVETMMPLYPTLLHIAYRDGMEATSPGSLIPGSEVYAGLEGSSSRLVFERMLERFEIDRESFTFIESPNRNMRPDVLVLFVPISPDTLRNNSSYRLLSMGRPEDIGTGDLIDGATLLTPAYRPFVIPAGTYGEMTPEPTVTIAVDRMLVARADLPPAVVYDFISEVLRLRPPMAAKWPGLFGNLSANYDVSRSSFNLHPGSQAFLQRDEPGFYERYSGVAEVAVTLMIGLVSAAFGASRIYDRYRKNRIDTFCLRAIQLRDSVPDDAGMSERKAAVQKIHELQNEAFEMLAAEKLAADESFQIFITLSNDVIRQIKGEFGAPMQSLEREDPPAIPHMPAESPGP